MTAENVTLSKLPSGVGSCSPISPAEIQPLVQKAAWWLNVTVMRYRILCEVPGLHLGTVSQYALLVEYECMSISGCTKRYNNIAQIIFMCHASTTSFINPRVDSFDGEPFIHRDADLFNPPPKRNDCGACVSSYRSFRRQPCRGMNLIQ